MFKLYQWRKIAYLLCFEPKKDRPRVIKHKNHLISCNNISQNALRVLYRLSKSGYESYLVGGGVRDMLLGQIPEDFDIATSASPQEIRKIFRNSRLIGRRFRLVYVYFPNEIIEVSTFRADVKEFLREKCLTERQKVMERMLSENNTYGTIEEDAWRRDFTVNALYYNTTDFSVTDFTGGIKDLHQRLIRMIGDPTKRYHEDPVRLLRAIRLAAKLNFKIHPDTEEPLKKLHHLLHHVPSARLFAEVLKIFFKGHAIYSYQLLKQTHYMETLFPEAELLIERTQQPIYENLIQLALKATDDRYYNEQNLNPGFLFAVFLWPLVQELMKEHFKKYKRLFPALHHGIDVALKRQMGILLLPRRLTAMMRSVWLLQYHLERRRLSRVQRVTQQRFFRAAFDFLELRERAGDPLTEIVCWWKAFRDGDTKQREQLINKLTRKLR